MIATLLRLLCFIGMIYGFFLTACPKWNGDGYHVVSLSFMVGGAVMLTFFMAVVELSSKALKISLEVGFVVVVALYLGWTFPQLSGRPPMKEWLDGNIPRRADAREGLQRLGVDTRSAPAKAVIALFPR